MIFLLHCVLILVNELVGNPRNSYPNLLGDNLYKFYVPIYSVTIISYVYVFWLI